MLWWVLRQPRRVTRLLQALDVDCQRIMGKRDATTDFAPPVLKISRPLGKAPVQ
jgi:hypothetical protein